MSGDRWFIQARWKPRLLAEAVLMKERFPGFWLTETSAGLLRWIGVVTPTRGSEFLVTLTYPSDYPYREPKLRVDRPALVRGAPHLYGDGSLCVHKRRWDPMRGTAASEVPLIAAWLVAYMNWRRTGVTF